MAECVERNGQGAFTWTGPYGGGKSSLALILSALIGPDKLLRNAAAASFDSQTLSSLSGAFRPRKLGWRVLPVIARRAEPAAVFGEAIDRCGLRPVLDDAKWNDDSVVTALTELAMQEPLERGGLVVFVDEMGKFLEAAANDNADLYFFQLLAEAANRSSGRLILVGILHQSFTEYARTLSTGVRDEWAKVQGRFVDLALNVSGDEQIELISRAIQVDAVPEKVDPQFATAIQAVRTGRANNSPDLESILARCWPLHPVVASLLGPISRRRFGQNQRSLFGFLNSAEPYGFQDFLKIADEGSIYYPDRLWDYLSANLEPAILASPDGHRWSTAVDAIDRCSEIGAGELHVQLLKTIALMQMFRERANVIASPKLLAACVSATIDSASVESALDDLRKWSFVIFKKHVGAFAIYAGSDFDIDQAVTESLKAVHDLKFNELRRLAGIQPILAKRHYHDTGALRWLDVDIIPLNSLRSVKPIQPASVGAFGQAFLVLPTGGESLTECSAVCQCFVDSNPWIIAGASDASKRVIELARELMALEKVVEERPELGGDSVARREIGARIVDVRTRLQVELRRMLGTARWHMMGVKPQEMTVADLSSLASNLVAKCFSKAPIVRNELLNRESPSTNAVTAQKTLLKMMVDSCGRERLGIDGYPAEGGLLDSILLKPGLYSCVDGLWDFRIPEEDGDPCNVAPALIAARSLLQSVSDRSVGIDEIYRLWKAPPYGIKPGLLPVLAIALLMAERDRIAFYRDGIFLSKFTDLEVDVFTRDPSAVQVRWMDLSNTSRDVLSGLARVVRDLDANNKLKDLSPIDVARGLVRLYTDLKPWTKRTARLSSAATRVRALLAKSSDPNKLLFDDIPGLASLDGEIAVASDPGRIVAMVRDGMQELVSAYPSMLERLENLLLSELQVPNSSPQALKDIQERAKNIHDLGGDFGLNAFVGRIGVYSGTIEDIEGIASLATNKPPRDWVDADVDRAAIQITDLCNRFVHTELFARVKGRPNKRHAIGMVLGVVGRPEPIFGEFSYMDTDRAEIESVVRAVEDAVGSKVNLEPNVLLAAYAELCAKCLGSMTNDKSSAGRAGG